MSKKQVAVAKIVDPSLVEVKCTAQGWVYDNGAIFCSIPELGFEGVNLVYCRYGLPIPYYKIQKDQKILVEPTIEENERWFYTGLVDCGDYTPADADQFMLEFLNQVIYASTSGTIHLSAKAAAEAFVLGTAFKAELDKHATLITTLKDTLSNWTAVPNDGGLKLFQDLTAAGFFALPEPDYSNILSVKIFGE